MRAAIFTLLTVCIAGVAPPVTAQETVDTAIRAEKVAPPPAPALPQGEVPTAPRTYQIDCRVAEVCDGEVRVLSSPRLVTVAGRRAQLLVGSQVLIPGSQPQEFAQVGFRAEFKVEPFDEQSVRLDMTVESLQAETVEVDNVQLRSESVRLVYRLKLGDVHRVGLSPQDEENESSRYCEVRVRPVHVQQPEAAPESDESERVDDRPVPNLSLHDTVTRVYSVADLVEFAPVTRNGNGGSVDYGDLVARIREQVSPESWEERGGEGRITPFESTLSVVVRQSVLVHQELETYLDLLRQR